MSPRKPNLPTIQRIREGEGVVIGYAKKLSTGMAIGMDFSTAPVPDRRLPADGAWVVAGSDLVRVVFAQFRAAGPELEHVVVARIPFPGARNFLRTMNAVGQDPTNTVIQMARAYLERVKAAPSPTIDRSSAPRHSFTIDANILVAGFSGREACLDLYQSSPQVRVAILRGATEFRAEPVARVTLTTRLLVDIFEEMSTASLPSDGQDDEIEVEHE